MSTDDSVSEDVSTSGALSHGHVSADGEAGKESEASLLSSEGTSASGRRTASHNAGGAVEGRTGTLSPACSKIRSLCLSTEEAFEQQKNLPFINPSSLETLRVLVQEIRSSGETDPEIWKDCEGRWLHLFQLVEKQYQEQILAQQEQYQCQIQLIQDEIKALVQLQNRQSSAPPHADFPLAPETKPASDVFPLSVPKAVPHDHTAFSSPSPPPHGPRAGERTATVLSSGYGTLSAWESSGLEPAGSPGDEEDQEDEDEEEGPAAKLHWSARLPEETAAIRRQQEVASEQRNQTVNPAGHQQKPSSSSSQQLTSWAQRTRARPRPRPRPRRGQAGPAEDQEQPPETHTDQDQLPAAGTSRCFSLRRSDSLMSEASGLTYWRLNESDLYRPLPDSVGGGGGGGVLLLQEASLSPEPRLSLREIYQNKQRSDWDASVRDGASVASGPTSPQIFTLDPAVSTRQSDRTSGFTSPSHFSSPSLAAQPHPSPSPSPSPSPRADTPDSPHPGDADCISDASAGGPPPRNGRGSWRHAPPRRGASEEEGSHTSTLKPPPPPGGPQLEDPVVLSLVRQKLREKHSRHVADLKAYYESEIQMLRERLQLDEPPLHLEESNRRLALRCQHLEAALSAAGGRVEELEAANGSLEKKLAEWAERYAGAGAALGSLQQRLDESKRSGREKDGLLARLRTRVQQLEEEAQQEEARRGGQHKMLQDLLVEHDSLMKEHEAVKNNLLSTESRLLDANDHICELKRLVSKLESQVKQIEHENQSRARFSSYSNSQPSGAGLFHHPDLLLSPSKGQPEPDVTRRRSACPPPAPPAPTEPPPAHQGPASGSWVEASSGGGSWSAPPEAEQLHPASRQREGGAAVLTPVMRALIELEETRATQSRAPWVGRNRTSVSLLERRHRGGPGQVEREAAEDPGGGAAGGGGGGAAGGGAGGAALLRAQRSLSPDGVRSSSLPPPAERNLATHTQTRRETLLAPPSVKSSPKRCPTENFSTAFGHLMPREEHLPPGLELLPDRRRHSFTSSPRKKLQFSTDGEPDSVRSLDLRSQLVWEDSGVPAAPGLQESSEEAPPPLDRLQSLSDAERLFDHLTQEKLQVEAALSRVPVSAGRVTLQTRLDEVALEKRLERLNGELGSLRRILKRFHVLRCSANT